MLVNTVIHVLLILLVFAVLAIESRVLVMLSKYSIKSLYPQSKLSFKSGKRGLSDYKNSIQTLPEKKSKGLRVRHYSEITNKKGIIIFWLTIISLLTLSMCMLWFCYGVCTKMIFHYLYCFVNCFLQIFFQVVT